MGKSGEAKEDQVEKQRAEVAIKTILDKVKNGTATPNDIAAAQKLNSYFDLDYAGDISIAASEVSNYTAAKSAAAPATDYANEPYAAASAYDKFLKTPEMQQVLDVHKEIAQGKKVTREKFAAATRSVVENQEQHLEVHKMVELRKDKLVSKIKSGTATAADKEEFEIVHAQDTAARKINAHHETIMSESKRTGKTVNEILADEGSSIRIQENLKNKHIAIELSQAEKLRKTLLGLDRETPAKEAEQEVLTGKKRKRNAMDSDGVEDTLKRRSPVQEVNPGDPLPSPVTPNVSQVQNRGKSGGSSDKRMP